MARIWGKLIWSAAVVEAFAVAATVAYLGLRAEPAGAEMSAAAAGCEQTIATQREGVDDPIVCTMRGDVYYHRRSCRYAGSRRIVMPLSRARIHHRPCSRCKPPH